MWFTEMKKTMRSRWRVRVNVDKIWSSVLDKLILGTLYTGKCSYRVNSRIYKSGTIRYTHEIISI